MTTGLPINPAADIHFGLRVGDFVCIYQGMGEITFGTLIEPYINPYTKIAEGFWFDEFTYEGRLSPRIGRALHGDVRDKSTPRLAMRYYWLRTGYHTVDIWLR